VSRPNGPVLIAYDGSESSATAIAVAGRLLTEPRAFVCHVSSRPTEAADALSAKGSRLARAAGFEAKPLPARERRKTWRTLLEAAERCSAPLIVVGAQGMLGSGHALLGSVSMALVHHSPVPVLVVPARVTEEATDGPLLLCYDGSGPAARAVAVARDLFGPRSAIVLHFWESWVAEAPALAGVSGSVRGMAAELDEIGDEQSTEITERGVELAKGVGFDASGLSECATGPGWTAVLDAADENSSAAIVIGSRGLSGISSALGSVSNAVVHHSRRPVLVVPPEADR
jgi:nucleotide-binding universal stress UspA family protein